MSGKDGFEREDPVALDPPAAAADTGRPGPEREPMLARLLHMVIIAVMLSLASTILTLATVIQFVIMLTNKGEPNERIADFGEGLGIWIAKAARYQVARSETRPWPWTDID